MFVSKQPRLSFLSLWVILFHLAHRDAIPNWQPLDAHDRYRSTRWAVNQGLITLKHFQPAHFWVASNELGGALILKKVQSALNHMIVSDNLLSFHINIRASSAKRNCWFLVCHVCKITSSGDLENPIYRTSSHVWDYIECWAGCSCSYSAGVWRLRGGR